MKRILALIFIPAILTGLLSGCMTTPTLSTESATSAVGTTSGDAVNMDYNESPSPSTEERCVYNPATDWPYGMNNAMDIGNVVPTENGYYMILKNFLLYMDADAMAPIPVCYKPNCLHYFEEDIKRINACNAFMNTLGKQASLSWHGGKLWYIGIVDTINDPDYPIQYALICMEPDGSARKVVYRFDPACHVDGGILHRGTFYIELTAYDEEARTKTTLLACSATNTAHKPESILEFPYYDGIGGIIALTAYGDCLYFYRYTSANMDREYCVYDLKTGEIITVTMPDEQYVPLNVTFIGDKIYLRCKAVAPQGDPMEITSYPECLYRCNLDGSEPELLLDGWGEYASDQQYLYRVPSQLKFDEEDHLLRIYDSGGKEVDQIDFCALANTEYIRSAGVMVPPGEQVLLWINSKEPNKNGTYMYWFDKIQIGTGSIEIHPLLEYARDGSTQIHGTDLINLDTSKMEELAKAAAATKTAE